MVIDKIRLYDFINKIKSFDKIHIITKFILWIYLQKYDLKILTRHLTKCYNQSDEKAKYYFFNIKWM